MTAVIDRDRSIVDNHPGEGHRPGVCHPYNRPGRNRQVNPPVAHSGVGRRKRIDDRPGDGSQATTEGLGNGQSQDQQDGHMAHRRGATSPWLEGPQAALRSEETASRNSEGLNGFERARLAPRESASSCTRARP